VNSARVSSSGSVLAQKIQWPGVVRIPSFTLHAPESLQAGGVSNVQCDKQQAEQFRGSGSIHRQRDNIR